MKHFLLFYDVDSDFVTKRAAYRDAHLQYAWNASARGEIILAGALTEPADHAVLLFAADSPAVVERFAQADPYVANGLVKKWHVREWVTVVGEEAATPVRTST
jgi:uncharacterized protein YciI